MNDKNESAGSSTDNNVEQFSFIKLLIFGIIGAIGSFIIFSAIVFILQKAAKIGRYDVVIFLLAPIGFADAVGRYIKQFIKTKALSSKHLILAVSMNVIIGIISGYLGYETAHPKIKDAWPVIMILGLPGLMLFEAYINDKNDK